MKKNILSTGVFCLLLSSCFFSGKKEVDKHALNDSITKQLIADSITIPSDSGVVCLDLTDGKGSMLIHKNADQTIYIEFESKGYKILKAQLSSEDPHANIRFSQITLPNGEMDGPFGRDLKYELPEEGIYKLTVHENMMAGDPWSGNFKIEIILSNQDK